jgi:hypothetical protein
MADRTRKAQPPPRVRRPEPPDTDRAEAPAPTGLLGLQRRAGNRAVAHLVAAPVVQRVPVTVASREETLFNQRGTPGTAGAAVYGSAAGRTLDMARGGTPDAITVTVRIRFVDDTRSVSAPDANGRTRPVDGSATGNVIPDGDARRPFAQGICDRAPGHWNGRAVLAGQRAAPGLVEQLWADPAGPVRLPVKFAAVPVWDLTSPADATIRVFPESQSAGGPAHPIDAGHYYMTPGASYAGMDLEAIYAHEYGHLIGLSDEYSQSNPQAHALLHSIDSSTSAARGEAMDREAVRRRVLAALTRPLMDRVTASTAEVSRAFLAGRAPMVAALRTGLRTALSGAAVKDLFVANAPPATAGLTPQVPGMVDAAVRGWSNTGSVASSVVGAELASGPVGAMVRRLYMGALSSAAGATADLGGIGMNITVEGNAGIDASGNAVRPPSGLWDGSAVPAGDLAATVNEVAGASRTGRVPPVRPSSTLLGALTSLPTAWRGMAASAPAELAGGTLGAQVQTALVSAWVAKSIQALAGGGPAPLARRRALAAAVQASVHEASVAAATNAVRAYLEGALQPVMQTSVTSMMTAIGHEVTRVMGTPAEQLAVTAPRDPAIASLATMMHARQAVQSVGAQINTIVNGGTAINPGANAPAQEVTYSTVNMMSTNDDIFRPDQFADIARVVNTTPALKKPREGDFHVEMGAS